MKRRRGNRSLNLLPTAAISLCLLCSAAAALPAADLEYNLRVSEIAPDTYVVTDRDYFWSNTLVARMPDGTVLLVSSPYENLGAATLLNWVRSELKPEKIVAVNTHFHLDGTGGNFVFREQGVETYASGLTIELQRTQSEAMIEDSLQYYENDALRQRVQDSETTPAEHSFDLDEGKLFDFGGEKVDLYFPGHAHSPDNLVVWFPKRHILFGGCIIKPGDSLGYLRDADVAGWGAAARKLELYAAEIVVPGHGQVGGPELLQRTIQLADREAARLEP